MTLASPIETPDLLIEALGGAPAVAVELNLRTPVVSNWRSRGKIPSEYWVEIASLAERLGVKEITEKSLAVMHARKSTDFEAEVRS